MADSSDYEMKNLWRIIMKQMRMSDGFISEEQESFQFISERINENSDVKLDQATVERLDELFKKYDKLLARCSLEILEEEFFEVIS